MPLLGTDTAAPLASMEPAVLRGRRLGIETHHEAIAFMQKACVVCRSEGFSSHARIRVTRGRRSIIATLYHVTSDFIGLDEVGLSESAWQRLGIDDGDDVLVTHPAPLESMHTVRGKVHNVPFQLDPIQEVIKDILAGRYSDIHLSSFVTACAAQTLSQAEVGALTQAMINVGDRIEWPVRPVMDKHCVGGLPGNRTTPIVVAILAACGFLIPKTSSRAITSPAGTADTMETMAPVDLDLPSMRKVVEREGGCVVWGKAMRLSPVDDILIRVERALDIDSGGQLVASVLSKKIAAGSTHIVIDVPVGPTAKIRTREEAQSLENTLAAVGAMFGIEVKVVITDGKQPVGRGIGPALEAREILSVLQCASDAPKDLRERSLALAGALMKLGKPTMGYGVEVARAALDDGRAWRKFQSICEAQGGMREPPQAAQRQPVVAAQPGRVIGIDNRRLAKAAKLAGAPDAKAAGIELCVRVGDVVSKQQPLFNLHAETRGEQAYAMDYLGANKDIVILADH